jgi:hypothetical protein
VRREPSLGDRLRDAAPLDEQAAARGWEAVRAAHAEREAIGPARRRGARRGVLLAATTLALLGALALSPAGARVSDWIDHAIHPPPSRPAAALPAPGRLLISGLNGSWVVGHDLKPVSLAEFTEADWSAKGNYVVLNNGAELIVRDTSGRTYWMLTRPQISHVAWSGGDGYRIAYRSGRQLRVVAGDGSGDRLLDPVTAAVTPSWRPGRSGAHVLAYVLPSGQVNLRDVDRPRSTQRVLVPPGRTVEGLAWATPDRLLVLRGGGLLLIDGAGRVVARVPRPDRGRFTALTGSPASRSVAFVRSGRRDATSVVWSVRFAKREPSRPLGDMRLLGGGHWRIAFAGAGTIRSLAFSPDGRWLAFAWPPSDQWIFQRIRGRPQLMTVDHATRRLGHAGGPAGSPIVGWAP